MSVCGTVIVRLKLRGFSWNHFQLLRSRGSSRHTLESCARICLSAFSNAATGTSNTRTTFRDPSPIASNDGAGILTCFPSATHFCLALGADSPYADERCVGNLGLTARGLSPPLSLLMSAFALPIPSSTLYKAPSQAYGTLSYHARLARIRSFGIWLSPVTSSAQDDSISELLRFL
ncbi:hypothetical protein KY49_7051 [Burkholderia sp. MSHR3999]|nr:hypothetical protein KY49_7051 [Burkholderia sp. MSHR3999]